MSDANRKPLVDAAESQTLRMRGNSLHGNRETLETPTPENGVGRSEKALGRTSDAHVSRESDDSIVPKKRANNAGTMPRMESAAAESVEERGSTKGNATQTLLAPDAVPGKRGIGLRGVREAAKWNQQIPGTAHRHQPEVGAV